MSKKKSRAHRRKNPLRKLTCGQMADIGDQLLAMGLGNMILDWCYPRAEGPRLPQLVAPIPKKVREKFGKN